jgi:carboxyl-terminal processing protease
MKKKISRIKVLIVSGLIIVFSFGFFQVSNTDFDLVKNLDIFWTLFRELNYYYVDKTDPQKLIETGINSMLNSLDPYTVYIPESEMDDFNFMTTGAYGGIGALIRAGENYAIISDPYEGFPAVKAGLMAGDELISIDGFNTKGKPLSEVSEKLKGIPGTDLQLIIKRPGESETRKIKLIREQIKINNVSYSGLIDNKTGYIRLSNFTLDAGKEVKDAFLELKNKYGINKLILDLRGNPGGLLIEAVRVCNLFVKKGQLIVSTKGKVSKWAQEYFTTAEPLDTVVPIVVLVNRGSASASEIVAGALQDIDRAVILGQRTYGKGLVQTTVKLKYNTQLKVTTAKYYIPSGRCIQALDYSHRNADGSVGYIPDSLITEFKTKNKRLVYDGGGITPDVKDTFENYSSLAYNLLYKDNIIFDFATDYVTRHNQKPDIEGFKINNADFEKFKSFVSNKGFSYKTQSEEALRKLIETAKREKMYNDAAEVFANLEKELKHDNNEDIDKFRKEIEGLINEEIISRYYYQKGKIRLQVEGDHEVRKAVELLSNPPVYTGLLYPDKAISMNQPPAIGEKTRTLSLLFKEE